jgi:hypothetical protein
MSIRQHSNLPDESRSAWVVLGAMSATNLFTYGEYGEDLVHAWTWEDACQSEDEELITIRYSIASFLRRLSRVLLPDTTIYGDV